MTSWPDRILTFWGRIAMAMTADPAATVAAVALFLGTLAAVAYGWHLTVWLERWIGRTVATGSARRRQSSTPDTEPCDEPTPPAAHLADVFDLHPPSGPPARHHNHHRTPANRHPDDHRTSRLPHKRRDRV